MRLSPLRNPGTSKVFYALVGETSAPGQLAARLGVKPPAVTEQLRRLEGAGVVRRGQKQGRFQHYWVNWDALTEFTLDALERYVEYEYVPSGRRLVSVTPSKPEVKRLRRRLAQNKTFQKQLIGYFSAIASDGLEHDLPISRAVADFTWGLLWLGPRLKPQNNRDAKEFRAAIRRWCEWGSVGWSITIDALMDSLEEGGLL